MPNNKERSHAKLKRVLKQKSFQNGKLPKGKEAHHVKPIAERGKTTKKNIHVVPQSKHKQIHSNRKKRGKI